MFYTFDCPEINPPGTKFVAILTPVMNCGSLTELSTTSCTGLKVVKNFLYCSRCHVKVMCKILLYPHLLFLVLHINVPQSAHFLFHFLVAENVR
jgi:hypothetical protein